MQSISAAIFNCQSLLVLLVGLVSGSNALQCATCLDPAACNNNTVTAECTTTLVNLHHTLLWFINPNLANAQGTGFKCYDLDISYESPLTGSTVRAVQKGCTYNETNFCEGWINTTTVAYCSTCISGDNCNQDQTEGTTTPAVPTTPLNNSTTTTVATTTVVSNTTTSAGVNGTTEALTTTTTVPSTTTALPPPANTTTTSASVTTPPPTTTTTTTPAVTANTTSTASPITSTTAQTGGAAHLGCALNWFTIAGYALLHGLVARW